MTADYCTLELKDYYFSIIQQKSSASQRLLTRTVGSIGILTNISEAAIVLCCRSKGQAVLCSQSHGGDGTEHSLASTKKLRHLHDEGPIPDRFQAALFDGDTVLCAVSAPSSRSFFGRGV